MFSSSAVGRGAVRLALVVLLRNVKGPLHRMKDVVRDAAESLELRLGWASPGEGGDAPTAAEAAEAAMDTFLQYLYPDVEAHGVVDEDALRRRAEESYSRGRDLLASLLRGEV